MRYQKQCLEKRKLGYKSFDKELLYIPFENEDKK